MTYRHVPSAFPHIVGGHGYPETVWGFLRENSDTFSHLASAVSSFVTALAVIIGGIWAYRKFSRGRTFKPRLSAKVNAHWHVLPDVGHVLQVRIGVTNIGATKLSLIPSGTGLTIGFPAAQQTTAAHRGTDEWWADVRWENVRKLEGGDQDRTFVILKDHQWIEPGETVYDDFLLNLGRDPTIVLVEAKLRWRLPRWWWKDKAPRYVVRQIVPPGVGPTEDPPKNIGRHGKTEVS
jgi:hypothetical protein